MTDERHDDEVLGRALSRAIETQTPIETPFEHSRIADQPARRAFGFWQFAALAAALVLALAFASWFTRPNEGSLPVAASPTASASNGPSQATAPSSVTPALTATPRTAPDHSVVYFARDGVPPLAVAVNGAGAGVTVSQRIASRIDRLASTSEAPGTVNAFPRRGPPIVLSGGASGVTVDGDLAKLDFAVPGSDWGVRGAAQSIALLQQLIYTATEEPGIRRVTITENGGKATRIDQLSVTAGLTRDEVDGYSFSATATIDGEGAGDVPASDLRLTTNFSVDTVAPGLARFVIQVDRVAGALPQGFTPSFAGAITQIVNEQSSATELGKYRLSIDVGAQDAKLGLELIDRTPLRAVNVVRNGAGTTYQLALDAGYPWRAFTLSNPSRIVVDIGGPIASISESVAVYSPPPASTIGRTFTVSGAARAFEATVSWRVKDSAQKEVATGHTLASLGSSPVWGTFQLQIALPASVTGNVTLEVFWASPKDGADQGRVAVPLTVR